MQKKINQAGRVVLAPEQLAALHLQDGDTVDVALDVDRDCIVITPHERRCPICRRAVRLRPIAGSAVCPECINKIAQAAGN